MDERVRDAYKRLLEIFRLYSYGRNRLRGHQRVRLKRLQIEIRDAIDDAEAELQAERLIIFREDAKLLLVVNYVTLIAAPLVISGRINEPTLRDEIRADIQMLMRTAADATPGAADLRGSEVTGHAIVDATSSSWKRMKLSARDIWE